MAFDDFVEPEVGIAVAVTAAIASPTVRKALRRSAVYSLAGVLMAGDAVMALARGVKQGVQQGVQQGAVAAAQNSAAVESESVAVTTPAPALASAPVSHRPTASESEASEASHKRGRKAAETGAND